MAKFRLLIHVGGPKTGTTSIQTALAENRHSLRECGFLYPGAFASVIEERKINQQFLLYPLGRIPGFQNFVSSDRLLWQQLVDEVNQSAGVVILSSEALLSAPIDVLNEIADAFETLQIEILITARSIHELVISHWQELVKAGGTISLGQYTNEIARGPKNTTDASLNFWIIADYVTTIQRWSTRLDMKNIIVQCVDVTQPDTTLRNFEQIAEIPSGLLGLFSRNSDNRSLTYSEAEFIRSCNEMLLQGAVSNHLYSTIDSVVRKNILSQMPHCDDAPIELPTSFYESIATFVNTEVQLIVDSGARIKGDISLLARIPKTYSDSRNADVKFSQNSIEVILRNNLLIS